MGQSDVISLKGTNVKKKKAAHWQVIFYSPAGVVTWTDGFSGDKLGFCDSVITSRVMFVQHVGHFCLSFPSVSVLILPLAPGTLTH